MSSLGFVCINYRSTSWTNRFLQSVLRLNGIESCKVVVVDNSTEDQPFVPDPDIDDSAFEVVRASTNLGYFGGAALGVSTLHEKYGQLDFIAISNVDLDFPDAAFIRRLTAVPLASDIGVVAPAIHSSLTNADQNPFLRNRPSAMRMRAYGWLFASYPRYLAYSLGSTMYGRIKRKRARGQTGSSPEEIYAAHGSFMILTRAFFERGGTVKYPCFLFGEEIFVAESCRSLGLRVLYRPDLVIRHQEHVSTSSIWPNRRMVGYMGAAARYCSQQYF